jgi:type VI secretion system protein ImpL
MYTFPQQFASLHELIAPFLEELFQSSRYAEDIMFRGVYFTSATQEGSPIDRIMGHIIDIALISEKTTHPDSSHRQA